jgi:hypothetical protein
VTRSPARRLILAYAAITALWYLYAFLPGGVEYPTNGQAIFWLVLDALIVWRLWLGSAGAWLVALGLALLSLLLVIFFAPGFELSPLLLLAGSLAQLAILTSHPVRAYVWSRRKPRVAAG